MKVFAIAAHPDDIEFNFAGTLLLLKNAGCCIHYMNMSKGSLGSNVYNPEKTAELRLQEAKNSAKNLDAVFHPPLTDDIEIMYSKKLISKLGSIIREAAPDILLIPSPEDYMEDHMNTCRIAVTAAFCRDMNNYKVIPNRSPISNQLAVYHAQPHGNRDGLNRLVKPGFFIDITAVIDEKIKMLAEHKSQKEFLDQTQGMDAYVEIMQEYSKEIGILSEKFEYAEGWRRHNPLGFCNNNFDPIKDTLKKYYLKNHN
ncbi:MAG TPA: PIG-L family deacetylase [Victivallales bacterium]|nr:PIG-L family deacetylase [Victivallales bacterium]